MADDGHDPGSANHQGLSACTEFSEAMLATSTHVLLITGWEGPFFMLHAMTRARMARLGMHELLPSAFGFGPSWFILTMMLVTALERTVRAAAIRGVW